MKLALHGMVTFYSNLMTDIRTAGEVGYDGLEVHTEKLWRFLDSGGTSAKVSEALAAQNIGINAIDIIGDVEATDREGMALLQDQTEILSEFASDIGAETIQLNAFEGLDGLSIEDNIAITAKNIKQMVRLGAKYGVRFQYEGAAWTPIHSLKDCLELVERVDEDNFGLVIDFWHFWASRSATPDDIAKLDKSIIYGVHCCGGTRPPIIDSKIDWAPEEEFRGYFPDDALAKATAERRSIDPSITQLGGQNTGEKEFLPVQDWVDAIKATGYDGWVSGEFLNKPLWEGDNVQNAWTMFECLKKYFR